MAVFSGPEIPNNGLVFYYDMHNTQRSWKGKPTTNLVASPYNLLTGFGKAAGVTVTNNVATNVDGAQTVGLVTGTGWLAYTGASTTNGQQYTTTWVIRKAAASTTIAFGWGGAHQGNLTTFTFNLQTGAFTGVTQAAGEIYGLRSIGDFWVVYYSSTLSAGNAYYPQITIGTGVNVYFGGIQIEAGSVSSPIVTGTRSSTQALLDLTNNNTIVANSLTYASNNTFSFNGTTDRIYTSTNTTYGNNTTWEAWVSRTASLDTYNTFMGRYLPYFGIMSDNKIIFSNRLGGTQQTVYSTGFTAVNNTWYHLVFTTEFDGTNTTSRIYINGVLNNSRTAAGAQGNEAYAFTVGIWYPTVTTSPFQGRVDSVKVYNRTLTAAEISQSFEATRSRYNL